MNDHLAWNATERSVRFSQMICHSQHRGAANEVKHMRTQTVRVTHTVSDPLEANRSSREHQRTLRVRATLGVLVRARVCVCVASGNARAGPWPGRGRGGEGWCTVVGARVKVSLGVWSIRGFVGVCLLNKSANSQEMAKA